MSTKPQCFTNSARCQLHVCAFSMAIGVRSKRTQQHASVAPQLIMLTARELEPHLIFERTKKEGNFTERGHDPEGLPQVTEQIDFRNA